MGIERRELGVPRGGVVVAERVECFDGLGVLLEGKLTVA